jgi:hypothetical protein
MSFVACAKAIHSQPFGQCFLLLHPLELFQGTSGIARAAPFPSLPGLRCSTKNSQAFFINHSPTPTRSFGVWIAILFTLVAFLRVSKTAGWIFVPYLAWVSFATFLGFMPWWMNPG